MEHIDDNLKKAKYEKMAASLVSSLKARRFDAYYCPTKEEARKKACSLVSKDASVGWGGSMTIDQIGLKEALKEKGCHLIDRDEAKSKEERKKLTKEAMVADVFLASANAVSMNGEIFEIDGMGGRVSAVIYGADEVILVVGMNKVVQTEEEAWARARNVAAPLNSLRLKKENLPCVMKGQCAQCLLPDCICAAEVKLRISMVPERIKVILVGEDLGL